jgi:hypothetical protein
MKDEGVDVGGRGGGSDDGGGGGYFVLQEDGNMFFDGFWRIVGVFDG